MRYLKKQFYLGLAVLLIFSLSLGSLAWAEEQHNSGGKNSNPSINDNSCPQYSSNRDHIIATHSNIVDNGNGTATAKFKTTQDCVKVSFSSYGFPSDWIPSDAGKPYEVQIYKDGQSNVYSKAGEYSITIDIPTCAPYQLDLYSGDEQKKLGVGGHGIFIKAYQIKSYGNCGKITVNKLLFNASGQPHTGISFELWSKDVLFKSGVTDSNGVVEFKDLPIGTYVLKEITLPGFTTSLSEPATFVVTNNSTAIKVVINTPKLNLISACSDNPTQLREWTVTNESNIDVPITWEIPGSTQNGATNVPGSSSVTLSTIVTSDDGSNPNLIKIYWGSGQTLTALYDGASCSTPTPSPSPEVTPSPSPEVTPSPSPEVTPSPSPEATPSPSPEVTPSPSPEVTPSPSPEVTPSPSPTASPSSTPGPAVTPTVSTKPTPGTTTIVEIDDEEPPIGGVKNQDDTIIDVEEESVPLDTLPKTGDSSPAPYYLIGAFAITTGFISLRKKKLKHNNN
ncbi:LPXTG-motif cell wall-anchored protein [Paenibacillus castaneae]|uniref:SpaA isopeptide-forming pilin-related protein n=1 Tax=Paenibacillus castaneae TaxID=474957 RepID=UPI000C9C83D3|nr:SpaA isopeptide-forming pilin-related protein [Paenibacillus castaneae]NIK79351.1 LPXTG-motif cell wall-anchored protein [Paenibacillus castaneae]